MESVVDTEENLDLQEDSDHVEGMASDMETHKVASSKQLICTNTDGKAP